MAGDHRQELGKFGETRACEELARRGYAVLARRYRTRAGEIDIVARDGPTIVFVEVKARTSERFGGGAAAIHSVPRGLSFAFDLDNLSAFPWSNTADNLGSACDHSTCVFCAF